VTLGGVPAEVQRDIAAFRFDRTIASGQAETAKLRASVAKLLRLLKGRYPSLFTDDRVAEASPTADLGASRERPEADTAEPRPPEQVPAVNQPSTAGEDVYEVLADLARSPSFQTVTRALEAVNDLNGLAGGIATVQAGTDDVSGDVLGMRVRFLWGTSPAASEPSLLIQAVSEVNHRYYYNNPELQQGSVRIGNDDRLYAHTLWAENEPPEAVAARLIKDLMRRGAYQGNATLEWDKALAELGRTLGIVVAARRGEAPWPVAPLFELVGDDWAITKAGVEYRTEPWPVFSPDQFPDWDSSEQAGGSLDEEAWRHPEIPAGIPPPEERLWKRASAYLPPRDIRTTPAGWRPVTISPPASPPAAQPGSAPASPGTTADAHPAGASPPAVPVFSGNVKREFCQRIREGWNDLADLFDVPPQDRRRFSQGYEPRDLWEWLEARLRLPELPDKLVQIDRADLAEIMRPSAP
jgi:hypothetical protein